MKSLLSELFATPASRPQWEVDLLKALGCHEQPPQPQHHAPSTKFYTAPPALSRYFDDAAGGSQTSAR